MPFTRHGGLGSIAGKPASRRSTLSGGTVDEAEMFGWRVRAWPVVGIHELSLQQSGRNS